MFTERFNSILNLLDIKVGVLAEACGLDRTYISHFKSGKRKPATASETANKLVDGIISCATGCGALNSLCELASLDLDLDEERLSEGLRAWLFEEDETEEKIRASRKRAEVSWFADKLDRLMTMADLSNASLSHIINVDASLISRYRSGERMPDVNSDLMDVVCATLWHRINKNERSGELADLMSVRQEELDKNSFRQWFLTIRQDEGAAENIIDIFDSFSMPATGAITKLADICPEEDLSDDSSSYQGLSGLQRAVLRFLATVIHAKEPQIMLYSDQNMDWMVNEPEFRMKWAMLMFLCVSGGTRIRIIHNIDRGMDEMTEAIRSWLPLYMSGMIEPFYSKKRNSGRFNHTIFLCPGLACVESSHVKGMESTAIYNYHTDDKALKVFRSEMKLLFEEAAPLMAVEEPADQFGTKDVYYTREQYDRHYEEIQKAMEDGVDVRFHILKEASFNNISIMLTMGYVGIAYETEPRRKFYFMHPIMRKAFEAYVTANCQ